MVKYSGNVGFHIPCEYVYHWDDNGGTVRAPYVSRCISEEMLRRDFHPQESFVSADGASWSDIYTMQTTDDCSTSVVTGNVCIKAIGVSASAVLFSDYHESLPAGTQLSLRASDGEQIYYSVNGSEFAPYTAPISYTGGDLTVSAYTQKDHITSRSYTQQQAGLTSLLLKDGLYARYADLSAGNPITLYLNSFAAETNDASILPIGKGTIRINGEAVTSGSSYPVNADNETYTIEIADENLLPQTYTLNVISSDRMPLPEGTWLGMWYHRSLPENKDSVQTEYPDYPCEDIPIAVELFDGKGWVRNLRTGETEPIICRQDGKGFCEIEFLGKTVTCRLRLSLPDMNNPDSYETFLNISGLGWVNNDPSDCLDSAFLHYVSAENLRAFPIYTDAELKNAILNYYAAATGKKPTDAKIGEDMDADYAAVLLYDGETLLDTYYVHRCGYFWQDYGDRIDISAYLTEPQPIVLPPANTSSDTATGDCNNDGTVTVDDAQAVLAAYAEQLASGSTGLTAALLRSCDIDGDGRLSASDAQYILIYYTENTISGKNVTWEALLKNAR